jgi:hypothetical protein
MDQPDPAFLNAVLKADEVAALLRYRSARTFHDKRDALERQGFPAKLPGINGWSRSAVMRWIDGGFAAEDGGELPAGPADHRPSRLERAYAFL